MTLWNLSTIADHALEMVEPYLFGTVLDIGCGLGRLTKPLAKRHPEWHLIGFDPLPGAQATEPNEEYRSVMPSEFDSAFSVLVFQHLPDKAVTEILEAVWPRPLRFQFVVGTERAPYSYQRSKQGMLALCRWAGYSPVFEADPVHTEWRWATCSG